MCSLPNILAAARRWTWLASARSNDVRAENLGNTRSRTFEEREAGSGHPTGAYLLPLLAIVATTLVTGLFTVTWNPYYLARVVAGALALWIAHRHLKQTSYQSSSSKDGLRAVLARPIPSTYTWRSAWLAPLIGVIAFAVWMVVEPPASAGAGSELS